MNKIMGIDLSLVETGIVCLEDGKILFQDVVKSKATDSMKEVERIMRIWAEITFYINKISPNFIVIEGLSYGSKNTSSLCQLAKLNYACESFLTVSEYKYLIVAPTALKKFITGKGNAKKEVMLMKILKRYGLEFENNNLADAYALCRYGESLLQEAKGQ